jgi:hypothetical protein
MNRFSSGSKFLNHFNEQKLIEISFISKEETTVLLWFIVFPQKTKRNRHRPVATPTHHRLYFIQDRNPCQSNYRRFTSPPSVASRPAESSY